MQGLSSTEFDAENAHCPIRQFKNTFVFPMSRLDCFIGQRHPSIFGFLHTCATTRCGEVAILQSTNSIHMYGYVLALVRSEQTRSDWLMLCSVLAQNYSVDLGVWRVRLCLFPILKRPARWTLTIHKRLLLGTGATFSTIIDKEHCLVTWTAHGTEPLRGWSNTMTSDRRTKAPKTLAVQCTSANKIIQNIL